MKIGMVLKELHASENDLAHALLRLAERHKVDHELFHLGRDLADWSHRHVRQIAGIAPDYGEHLDPEQQRELGIVERARERASELTGRSTSSELGMLRDLRDVYLKASAALLDWEMLGQAAQAIRHDDLLSLATRCQSDTTRQIKWANSKIKEASTQALVT